ncbi:MAG: Gfo/Idh/MocA family oxidoreductase [Balneolaceae bacterium]|nr:Gfo/Idh/MocA family oxidoreductase [Balneolaceae bacterium]
MSNNISRKDFLVRTGSALAVSAIGFPSIILPQSKEKLGVALVGLGYYATNLLAPGLQQTEHCELRGIVTGSPEKIPVWQEKYGIPDANVYNYETMHEIANNDDIDIVYIVLPNSMHAEYSIIGANAGKHVWCEKPMAMDVEECQAMIDAANKNGVKLAIGYRMQHEPNTQTLAKYGKEKTYGDIRSIRSGGGFRANHEPDNWRAVKKMGGGSLYDVGVYPMNCSRFITGMEPVAVRGKQWSVREDIYSDCDEYTDFEMEFSNGFVMEGRSSFGEGMNYLDVDCSQGWYRLRPFFSYGGVQGATSDGTLLPPNPNHQQARQMDDDALAIKENRELMAPGEEGLRDIRILRAIMDSSRLDGQWMKL